MIQNTNISFLGGDLRNVKLAQMMKKDGFNVKTYALEKSLELQNIEKLKKEKNLTILLTLLYLVRKKYIMIQI